MTDFGSRVASYQSERDRRVENQRAFPRAYVPCPGCTGEPFSWCPVCVSTGWATRATARTFSEPKSDRQTERAA